MNRISDHRARRLLLACTTLSFLLAANVYGGSLCLEFERNGLAWRLMRASNGDLLRVSFDHSIYGSRVEEVFRLSNDGFHLAELRYAEPRLSEFYGYDNAVLQNGMWIVKPRRATISSLTLRTAADRSFLLLVEREQNSMRLELATGSLLNLTIGDCKEPQNG